MSEQENNLLKIKADFRLFLWYVWRHLSLPDPTPVQYDIALYLQSGPRRRMIEAFRGVGKSWITSAYCCWLLLNNAEEKILVVSASKQRSDDFSIFTKRLIHDLPILAHLKAKEGQRDSNIAFDVGPAKPAHAPSVKSVGITGQLTGSRATRIIADDIESLNNSLTQNNRDKLMETVKEFDAIILPGGEITYLGTPQTEMSIYNVLPERGYEVRIWPARFPLADKISKYEGKLAPYVADQLAKDIGFAGRPVDPKRFTDLDLVEREASYGRSGFALQFMLDVSLADQDRYPLKCNDLMVLDVDREVAPVKVVWSSSLEHQLELPCAGLMGDRFHKPMWVSPDFLPFQGSVMFIDPSGRGKDETGYAVVKMLNGMLYLTAVGGFREGYTEDTLTKLAIVAAQQNVNYLIIEDNFGDGMFTQLFKPILLRHHKVSIDPEGKRHHTQKERRIIDTLEPVLNQHRLVVSRSVVVEDLKVEDPKYQLVYQLSRITKDRGALAHDDRLEAVAGAVAYWVEQMGRDQELVMSQHREEVLQQELERFMDNVLGSSSREEVFWGSR